MAIAFRYIENDVDSAVNFYRSHFGFAVEMHNEGKFAALSRDGFRLYLNAPGAGGAGADQGGMTPAPGGWNRLQFTVNDIAAKVASLRAAGVHFRGDIVSGGGGKQALAEDPSGNVVELFEPKKT